MVPPAGYQASMTTPCSPSYAQGQRMKGFRACWSLSAVPVLWNAVVTNAVVTRAYLEVKRASQSGDVWADGRVIEVDVQKGYFGTSQAIQADDWKARAEAPGVAQVSSFTSETTRSSDFSEAGLKAINMTGATQIRLRANKPHTVPNNCLFIQDGADAKLFLGYQLAAEPSR